MSMSKVEISYFTLLGSALHAGQEAGDKHDLDDWYPCGNALVMVKPRNSKFAHWLLNNEFGEDDNYHKSIKIRCSVDYGQVMQAKLLWASAAAQYLRDNGINAWVWSYAD